MVAGLNKQAQIRRPSGTGGVAPDRRDGPEIADGAIAQPRLAVILTGTDPDYVRGGIATAVAGYRDALIECGLFGGLIPTFRAGSVSGKVWPWLTGFPRLAGRIRALRRQGRRVVVYGHAGPKISLLRESLILLCARLAGARTLLQLHAPHLDRYMDRAIVRALLRLAFIPVSQVTVLSPWWQLRLADGGFDNTAVIPNPLSRELEDIARASSARGGAMAVPPAKRRLTVLALARLTRGKAVNIAVEAMSHLPDDFVLQIAGDGPERERLEALARDLGVHERVRFLGWVSGAEKNRCFQEADIFCTPSKADSFNMSMIEAISHGLPVVTVRSRGVADLVEDGETGFIVDVDDARAVAQAIRRLADPALRARIGKAGAAWVLSNLSRRVVGTMIERCCVDLLPAVDRRE